MVGTVPGDLEALGAPIERPNTYDLLAQRLLGLIANRHLAVGDALPSERELVQQFGVGRSSVREALRVLESKGLIDQRANRFVVSETRNPLNSSLLTLLELQRVATLLCSIGVDERRFVRAVGCEPLAPIGRDHFDADLLAVDVHHDVVKWIPAWIARRSC